MPHVQYWARVRAGMDCPLRRGAWYRVVELTAGETVLEVNRRLLRVPRTFLQILPLRPPMWSPDRRAERWRAPARWRCARSPRRSACEREGQIGKDASERLAVTPLFEAKIPWLPTCHGLVVRLPQPRACTTCIRARAFPGTPLAPTHAGPGVRCQSEGPVTSS